MRAVVVGGGNTAIDVARELARLGVLEVTHGLPRRRSEMSGYAHEMRQARRRAFVGVTDMAAHAVLRRRDGQVSALRVAATEDAARIAGSENELSLRPGRRRDRPVEARASSCRASPASSSTERGSIVVDPATGRTGHRQVYAGGDCVNGGKEVVNAVADGKRRRAGDPARACDPHLGWHVGMADLRLSTSPASRARTRSGSRRRRRRTAASR